MVDVIKDGKTIPAKVVYARNRNKRKEYLCIFSTDVNLDEDEIIRIYGCNTNPTEIATKINTSQQDLNLDNKCYQQL